MTPKEEYNDRLKVPLMQEALKEAIQKKLYQPLEPEEKDAEFEKESLKTLTQFKFLSPDLDFDILRNQVLLTNVVGLKTLLKESMLLGLASQRIVGAYQAGYNVFTVDAPILAIRTKLLEFYVRGGCPSYMSSFVEHLMNEDLRYELNETWSLVLHDKVLLASRRVYAKDSVVYFLTLPSAYTVPYGFLEPRKELDNPLIGWSPSR